MLNSHTVCISLFYSYAETFYQLSNHPRILWVAGRLFRKTRFWEELRILQTSLKHLIVNTPFIETWNQSQEMCRHHVKSQCFYGTRSCAHCARRMVCLSKVFLQFWASCEAVFGSKTYKSILRNILTVEYFNILGMLYWDPLRGFVRYYTPRAP